MAAMLITATDWSKVSAATQEKDLLITDSFSFSDEEAEADNDELNKQLQEAHALLEAQDQEMDLQNETIRKFESINIYNQTRIYNLEQALLKYQQQPEPLQYPNNYSDIPEWINNNFSGRIELLPRAVRSLKDAIYKDINLVCQLIVFLI